MTEIRVQVDLDHPVELVWRALTEPPLLARWFVEADIRPRSAPPSGSRAVRRGGPRRLRPDQLAEVTAVDPPRKLVMRWRSEQLRRWSPGSWSRSPDGCRLVVTQVGFLGVRGTERRARAAARPTSGCYGERLPAVLAELAGGRAGRARAARARPAARGSRPSTVRAVGGGWRSPARRRDRRRRHRAERRAALAHAPTPSRPARGAAPRTGWRPRRSRPPAFRSSRRRRRPRARSGRHLGPPAAPAGPVAEGTPVAPRARGVAVRGSPPVATLPGPAGAGRRVPHDQPGRPGRAAFRGAITVTQQPAARGPATGR